MSSDHVHAITDLILGITVLFCALRLSRIKEVHHYWKLAFWFAAASAIAGSAHHGLFQHEASWIVVGVLIVIALSYLLVGSAREVLGRTGLRIVFVVRVIGLAAYGAFVIGGRAGLTGVLVAESLTMATILGLWIHAAITGHPGAWPVIRALLAFGLAGLVFVLPIRITSPLEIDSTSLTHLALIPGMVLLYRAVGHIRPGLASGD